MTENIKPEATYLSYPHIPSAAIGLPWSEAAYFYKYSALQPLLYPDEPA